MASHKQAEVPGNGKERQRIKDKPQPTETRERSFHTWSYDALVIPTKGEKGVLDPLSWALIRPGSVNMRVIHSTP
jgi:hypothetical protein